MNERRRRVDRLIESSGSSASMLEITVTDPETHKGGTVSFVDFKVTITTDDPRFQLRNFFVRRRYSDFKWLRGQLTLNFPGCIVPPLPPADNPAKALKGEIKSFAPDFIARRQAGLELFLRRVAAHHQLVAAPDLVTFLEAKVWELQTAKNASSSTLLDSMLDSTEASLRKYAIMMQKKTPDDAEVEGLRAFASEYYSVVEAAARAHQATVSTIADAAGDLSNLGPAFDLLSQSERELSLPFTHMARELDALRELFLKQVQAEGVSGLSALLTFNAGMAASLKDVLKNRDHAQLEFSKSSQVLDLRTKERQSWQMANADKPPPSPRADQSLVARMFSADPLKGQKLQTKVMEAERELEEAQGIWDEINKSISVEALSFHRTTNIDFAHGLREHIHQQLAFEDAQQHHWRQLLAVFEKVP